MYNENYLNCKKIKFSCYSFEINKTIEVSKEQKSRKSGKPKKKKFVEKNKRFSKELSKLVESVIKQSHPAYPSESISSIHKNVDIISQNKRKGSISKKKKKSAQQYKKKAVFDYKEHQNLESKDDQSSLIHFKNIVPNIKLTNLVKYDE